MSSFKKGDWVQITPQPDKTWYFWSAVYDEACSKVGQVVNLEQGPNNNQNFLYEVEVDLDDGQARLIFRGDHLIHSTKYDAKLNEHYKKVCNDLQEWEKDKKEKTDYMLRYIFGAEEPKIYDPYDPEEFIAADYPDEDAEEWDDKEDDWEDITTPIVPLPGLLSAKKFKKTAVAPSHILPDYTDEELQDLLDNISNNTAD